MPTVASAKAGGAHCGPQGRLYISEALQKDQAEQSPQYESLNPNDLRQPEMSATYSFPDDRVDRASTVRRFA